MIIYLQKRLKEVTFRRLAKVHCPTINDERYTLLSTLNNTDPTLLELTKSSLLQTLLYGNTLFDKEKNTRILNATIEYILSTERFEEPLI